MKWLRGVLCAVLIAVAARADAQAPGTASGGTTFRYASGPVSTFATNPTDWVVLTGSTATKLVGITFVQVCGTVSSGNPAATLNISFLRRSSADTGGTGTPITPANITGNGLTATGAVSLYSANPTLGTAAGTVAVPILNIGGVGSGGCVNKEFGSRAPAGPLLLRGSAQQLAINLQGVTMPAGVSLNWELEVVEQ